MLVVEDIARPGMPKIGFRLDDGVCLAVMGPSGCGKTLLLRALADLDPNAGTVMLDGANRNTIPAPEWRRKVAYVPAQPGWWADTPAEHFKDWETARQTAKALLLPDDIGGAPVERLSTGERQRLALLRAFEGKARVFLLDEPTGPLDSEAASAVEQLISDRRSEGAAILLVTHDTAQATRLAERVLRFFDDGVREAAA